MTDLLRFICRSVAVLFVMLATSAAWAHPGHLAGLAGHDHWVAGAAIGLAIALGVYGALKGKGADAKAQTEEAQADGAEGDSDKDEVPA